MHELAVIENIMNISFEVAEQNGLAKIDKINLTVGKLQHLNEMIMQHAFSALKENTLASEARLIVKRSHILLRCTDCGISFEPAKDYFLCPECSSGNTEIVKGNELFIKSIEGT